MELFTARNERKREQEFEAHCDQVAGLLRNLDGRVDDVAEQLDENRRPRHHVGDGYAERVQNAGEGTRPPGQLGEPVFHEAVPYN